MYRTFIPGIAPPPVQSEPAWWFAFVGNKLLVRLEGTLSTIPNLISLGEIGSISRAIAISRHPGR
ncbi:MULTISPECIES: hypothetical protein [Cyanophyceae]|uniref:hypothetical protein n=1 Tax=Cyanophyceae TaxID=3028117 RepID=UPI0016882C00|nr:hypothetical protein [Trichocoleus sp. FACHB-40]MBD2004501.1 hypothetical protein [Trichocoleus sp. FACHB-40]